MSNGARNKSHSLLSLIEEFRRKYPEFGIQWTLLARSKRKLLLEASSSPEAVHLGRQERDRWERSVYHQAEHLLPQIF